jgi:molecular chaperone GrpE
MDENSDNEMPKTAAPEEEVTKVDVHLVEDEEIEPETDEDLAGELRKAQELVLRKAAEFENFRKRTQRDLADVRAMTQLTTLSEFLPVMDHFNLAMIAADNSDDLDTLKQGMKMIMTEFDRCFEKLGLTVLETIGQQFDPNLHHAAQTESSEEAEGTILRQFRRGYQLGERLVRPATVVVSSGPATAESAAEDESPNDE